MTLTTPKPEGGYRAMVKKNTLTNKLGKLEYEGKNMVKAFCIRTCPSPEADAYRMSCAVCENCELYRLRHMMEAM